MLRFICLASILFLTQVHGLGCVGDDGASKDWWFAYKHIGTYDAEWAQNVTSPWDRVFGNRNYTYADDENPTPTLSKYHFDDYTGAARSTIKPMFDDNNIEYILINDQPNPPYGPLNLTQWYDVSNYGHQKGVIAWDPSDGTGYWIIHSFPYFPCGPNSMNNTGAPGSEQAKNSAKHCPSWAHAGTEYLGPRTGQCYHAQMAVCFSIAGGLDSFNFLAANVLTAQPNVYDYRVSEATGDSYPYLKQLSLMDFPKPGSGQEVAMTSKSYLMTPKNVSLIAFETGKSFSADLWSRIIQPELQQNISVSTWYEGCPTFQGDTLQKCYGSKSYNYPLFSVCNYWRTGMEEWTLWGTHNVSSIVLDSSPYGSWNNHWNDIVSCPWSSEGDEAKCATGDHSKWAIGTDKFCVGDKNRSPSQENRGGGAVCFTPPDQFVAFMNKAITPYPCYNTPNPPPGAQIKYEPHPKVETVRLQ